MTAFPTPGVTTDWGDDLNSAVAERLHGPDNPDEWGASLGYDEEFASGSGLPSGWAWVNQGTATYTRSKGHGIVSEPTAASGNQVRLIERAIPTEGTFEAVFKLTGRMYPAGDFGIFVHLRDSVSGKIVTHGRGSTPPAFDLWNWTNASNLSAVVTSVPNDASMVQRYWKIRKNSATSWDFEASDDGVAWNVIRAGHNVQTFLGTAPTHIGFGLWRNNLTLSAACDWFRVR